MSPPSTSLKTTKSWDKTNLEDRSSMLRCSFLVFFSGLLTLTVFGTVPLAWLGLMWLQHQCRFAWLSCGFGLCVAASALPEPRMFTPLGSKERRRDQRQQRGAEFSGLIPTPSQLGRAKTAHFPFFLILGFSC